MSSTEWLLRLPKLQGVGRQRANLTKVPVAKSGRRCGGVEWWSGVCQVGFSVVLLHLCGVRRCTLQIWGQYGLAHQGQYWLRDANLWL